MKCLFSTMIDAARRRPITFICRFEVKRPGRTRRALCANAPIVSFVWSVNETQFALGGVGKGIGRRDLCSPDSYRSKQMSSFSWRNNGGRPDSSLSLCGQKKGLAKLELKVHVIQTLIKPLLLILHETGFLLPPLWALLIVTQLNQGYKRSEGLFFPPFFGLDQRVFLE